MATRDEYDGRNPCSGFSEVIRHYNIGIIAQIQW